MQHKNQSENLLNEEKPQRVKYMLNPHSDTENTYEKKRGKKLTIPDQSLSVKEIMQRFTRGQRIPDQMVGYYDEDYDPLGLEGTNIETLDLSQKYELLRALSRQNRTQRNQLQKEENAKKLSKLKEELTKEITKELQPTQHIDS